MSHDVHQQAGDSSHVRVAVFDRRPLAADGIAALLARTGGVEIVGVETTVHAAVRLLESTDVDTVVVGISAKDPAVTRRLLHSLPPEKLAAGPRLVGVVSGNQELADGLSGIFMTALTTEADPDTLRDMVVSERSDGIIEIPPSIIMPLSEPEEPPTPSHPRLTPREREVLERIESGLSTKEIAWDLGIAANTVRTHAQRLMAKLAVHSRVQAAAIAATEFHSAVVDG